jgi:hypothetical protein
MSIDPTTEGVLHPREGLDRSVATAAELAEIAFQHQETTPPVDALPPEPHDEIPRRIGEFDPLPDTPEHDDTYREALHELEDMPGGTRVKLELLLAALSEKPASMVEFDFVNWTHGEAEPPLDDAKYHQLVEIARKLGLHVHAIEQVGSQTENLQKLIDTRPDMPPDTRQTLEARMGKGDMQKNRSLLVSRSAERLDELKSIHSLDPHTSQYDQRLGAILGFPPTATKAYVEGSAISARQAGEQDPSTLAFAQFMVSPENATEELETARRWAQSIQEVSPKIYEQVMSGSRQS